MNPTATPQQVENRKLISIFLAQKARETGKKEFSWEEDPEIMDEFTQLIRSMNASLKTKGE